MRNMETTTAGNAEWSRVLRRAIARLFNADALLKGIENINAPENLRAEDPLPVPIVVYS